MRILGDSNITTATLTATNLDSAAFVNKLKTFQLVDKMITNANSTIIDLTYDPTEPPVNCVAICGSSLTATATISLSYSDTDISSPEATIALPTFSSLNQIFFLSSTLQKKYWRLTISDSSLSTIFIGYIYIGVYYQVPAVTFGHNAMLDIHSIPQQTETGQGYGSKRYNSMPLDFTTSGDLTEITNLFTIIQNKQNIDPVLITEYEESYDLALYRPKYGVFSKTSYPFPMQNTPKFYAISLSFEERF